MAKTSSIQKNLKKVKLLEIHKKRAALKKIINNKIRIIRKIWSPIKTK